MYFNICQWFLQFEPVILFWAFQPPSLSNKGKFEWTLNITTACDPVSFITLNLYSKKHLIVSLIIWCYQVKFVSSCHSLQFCLINNIPELKIIVTAFSFNRDKHRREFSPAKTFRLRRVKSFLTTREPQRRRGKLTPSCVLQCRQNKTTNWKCSFYWGQLFVLIVDSNPSQPAERLRTMFRRHDEDFVISQIRRFTLSLATLRDLSYYDEILDVRDREEYSLDRIVRPEVQWLTKL